MGTSLSKVQFPFREKGQTTCIHHQNRQLELYCETCRELACTKCLSTLHKTHTICDLSEITTQKKEDIRNFVDNTEKVDLVQIDQYINSTGAQLNENVSHFEKLSIELQTQTNKLKHDLDLLTARSLSLYKQMEEDNTKLLQTYKQDPDKYSTHDLSVGSSAEQGSSLTEQNSKEKEGHTLLTETKVLGEWRAPCFIKSVCPTTDGQVWTSEDGSNTLTLLDRKGKVIQKVKHNTKITDITQSPTTNKLWICDRKHNITELASGQLVHRFSTSAFPKCICITATNHVIVGMTNNISKYTTNGNLVLTTSATGTRKPLVCYPYRITECPVTHNVAVADWDSKYCGGEGKQRVVVVMDTDFKKLFVYGGEVPSTYQPTSPSGGEPFNPWGVVYDSVGNLVIGDRDNNRILLISGRGEFLRVIHTDDYWTTGVGIDREGVLWAVFAFNKVIKLQYRERIKQCIIS